ncbi:hypothetical protein [Maribellus sediminis]|uniref:hypothetical protein n=1 Tax=Maribellus sediminis TaxID=2696285 RepID=UPI0014321577|nr:hypothetical protein [Maribellus sediminis]
MKTNLFVLLVVAVILGGCATTMSSTWKKSDYEGRSFNKILVVAESSSKQGRVNSENTIVERLQKEGINATNSLSVFPLNENVYALSPEEIEDRILKGGYDGVLISSLADANSREVREGGGTYAQPVTYRYGRMIRTGYVHVQEPEYYRREVTYVLQTQLYDAKDSANKESVVWAGQAEITDPSSLESGVKDYAKALVKSLLDSGVIK